MFENAVMPSPADPGAEFITPETPVQPSQPQGSGASLVADPQAELLLGKFPNTAEGRRSAEQAYWNAVAEMNRAKAINDDYAARVSVMPQSQQANDPFSELESLGVNRDTWLRAMAAVVDARVTPLTNGIQAHAQFEQKHPEYVPHRGEVAEYIASNPELANDFQPIYQANGYRGLEWAWDRFREAKKMATPASAADSPSSGSLPSGGVAPRSNESEKYSSEKAFAANEHYQRTGDMGPLLAEMSKKIKPIL